MQQGVRQMTAKTLERKAFNIPETARQVGLSENIVRRALREGQLRHVRVGRRVLISDAAIREFLDGGDSAPANPA
jgi:excisionase family DNA binding protein